METTKTSGQNERGERRRPRLLRVEVGEQSITITDFHRKSGKKYQMPMTLVQWAEIARLVGEGKRDFLHGFEPSAIKQFGLDAEFYREDLAR